jgi:hypothetical protein
MQLDRIRDPNPAILTPTTSFGEARLESRLIGQLGCSPHRCRIVADVINGGLR